MAGVFTTDRNALMQMEMERDCELMFQRWCAEELVDPHLREVLYEAFAEGFIHGRIYHDTEKEAPAHAS